MGNIGNTIDQMNRKNHKALSVFLTAGYPKPDSFVDLACDILDAGADMLEIGIPFSDPLADGPVIQHASKQALNNGITMRHVFDYAHKINKKTEKPLILMGYANPILHYGIKNFIQDAQNSGVSGVIIPDIPLEEKNAFWEGMDPRLDQILLVTPASPVDRIKRIDEESSGFVYCVSVTGTTGINSGFNKETILNLGNTYSQIKKNKMLIGFGISNAQDIKHFYSICDGVIVGSAVIRQLTDNGQLSYGRAVSFVKTLSTACREKLSGSE